MFSEIREVSLKDLEDWEGHVPDLSNEDYHQDYDYLGASSLVDFKDKGPGYVKALLNPLSKIDKTSKSMTLGTYMHEANLEGKISKFVLMPEVPSVKVRRERGDEDCRPITEVQKSIVEKFLKKKKQVVTKETYDSIHRANHSFIKNVNVRELIQGCDIEQSYRFLHAETGLKCKFRPDAINFDESYIVDYKTTAALLNPKSLMRQIVNLSYHIKACKYIYGAERLFGRQFAYYWLFQSTSEPYQCLIIRFEDSDVNDTLSSYQKIMSVYQEHLADDFDQDFSSMTFSTSFPPWAQDLGWIE